MIDFDHNRESMEKPIDSIEGLVDQFIKGLSQCETIQQVYRLKSEYLGKQGIITLILNETIRQAEDKKAVGQEVNAIRQKLESQWQARLNQLQQQKWNEELLKTQWPAHLLGLEVNLGSIHVIHQVSERIMAIWERWGFQLEEGPWVESDWYNFEALNIPVDHPARDMQDTFFLENGQWLLRTHTSPIQVRVLEKKQPPVRVIGWGSVFRCDHDVTHLPHFHQLEGLWVDRNVTLADLKGLLEAFVKNFFEKDLKTRFRPSYFPFTQPSAEVDCQCPICQGEGCSVCKHSGWLELGGCGLVHPRVLLNVGLDPEQWEGLAFGLGVERLAMILYGIEDIRWFVENHPDFVSRFHGGLA